MNRKRLQAYPRFLALLATLAMLLTGGCATVPAPPDSRNDLTVEVWSDRENAEYSIGETLQLYLRVNQNAQVVVFNIDARDRTTVLFPNESATQNRLAGGQTVQLPGPDATYRLRVGPPAGRNRIRVMATTSEHPILDPGALSRGTGPFPEYSQSTDSVARRIQVVATEQPGVRWAMQDYVFRVIP